jgi:hypothetical protein
MSSVEEAAGEVFTHPGGVRALMAMTGRVVRDAGERALMPIRRIQADAGHASDSASIASRSRTA